MINMVDKKTSLFIIIVFLLSFVSAGIFYLTIGDLLDPVGFVFAIFYMFIPLLSVLIVEKLIYKENIKDRLFINFKPNKWFVVAWLAPFLMIFLTIVVSLLFPGVSYSPGMEGMFERYSSIMSAEELEEMRASMDALPFHPIWIIIIQGLIAGVTVNAIAGFGEEIGWRGFLVRQFMKMSFIKASLLIGFIWGLWHAPMILMGHNYPNFPVIGVFMMTIWCILLSPLFLYILIKSKSVIAASILHGSMNALAGISIMMVEGGHELIVGIIGLSGFIALIIIIIMMFFYDRYVSKDNIMTKKELVI